MNTKKYVVGLVGVLLLVGCSKSGSIERNGLPVAAYTFSCTDLSCDFDASGSSDDGAIVSYSWSFDAMGATTNNTFDSGGTYPVTLTVMDDRGASARVTQDITVTDPPTNISQFVKNQFAQDANSEPAEINDIVFIDPDEENADAFNDLLMIP